MFSPRKQETLPVPFCVASPLKLFRFGACSFMLSDWVLHLQTPSEPAWSETPLASTRCWFY